ncbi:glycoside hydrolase family 3 N-terminal domain-containing protein [Aquimarina sp. 2201CG5-10]|uniref:glycoside hydrolase family 3 N-terminal domain-containing protein n=1 Tax=Aquimarina callyspongiae TaxID=3098150 RepID=UPI002AB5645A|nr:glycoside hydrolase family 3 N-terminal domain-containing protein [Aquimarina sp. 2201CG5-10]MDY8138737.1 glycoside hydrolase family 3 N-terminal domain-containing protein [Aquimarina sp. 2201CG5-10]
MRHFSSILLTSLLFSFLTTIQGQTNNVNQYTLDDFYKDNPQLDVKVDSIFNSLSTQQKVAQMIISCTGELGKPEATVKKLVENDMIGGVVFLKGSKKQHTETISALNTISNKNKTLPLLFSMDAEPSLLSGRIKGAQNVGKTIDIKTEVQSDSIVQIINQELKQIGVHHNYAPVLDISPNNEAIKSRSYGSNKDSVINLANRFIKHTQQGGIIATAKHFPGHGLVKGDTHKQSVYIDGPLQEVENYIPIIEDGVLSIMIAHITVQNNETFGTNGLPSSCSRRIITDLLKDGMCFEGIIISDALNIMKAVTILDNAPLLASKAGCDMILMPQDEEKTMTSILAEMKINPDYQKQVMESVKKILRLKICSNVIK